MSLKIANASVAPVASPAAAHPAGGGVPSEAVLEAVAGRVRAGGLFLAVLAPDGALAYHDAAAGPFFQRFVLPRLQCPGGPCQGQGGLGPPLGRITAASEVTAWDLAPGVVAAAFPYVERRQVAAVLVLAGKAEGFAGARAVEDGDATTAPAFGGAGLTEDVLRACGRLGLDAAWLAGQAAPLPAYSPAALRAQARLVLAMARDQARAAALEQELHSLSGQLSNTYEELSLIYQISSGMKITRGAGEFFRQACLDVLEVMSVGGMGVALCADRRGGSPPDGAAAPDGIARIAGRPRGWRQEPVLYGQLSLPPEQVHRLAEELLEALRRRKAPLLVNDLSRDQSFAWAAPFARQLLAVPLQRQDQVLGCLFAVNKRQGEFDSADSKLLNSIANESAIYLENARLYEDVRDLVMGLLHALTSAVDAKDAYTCGHSERVALLSQRVARQAGLPAAQVERVYMAGLLHDVGKIGVPEAVLHKAGRLNADEFEHMKKHPQIGAHILADIKQVEDILPGVLHHHERYDGKGYPSGLCGQDIPLMGRIICLSDCFDAMTSNRTYRKALPLEVALTEIRRCAGTQFDPGLADAFLGVGPDELRGLLRDHQQGCKPRLKL